VPTYSELSGNVNKLKRQLEATEEQLAIACKDFHNLREISRARLAAWAKAKGSLTLSIAVNVVMIGALITIAGVLYVR
jgi:Pyruvate/2-oxoacid:ferredoxin oxidoreductase gamma subunit